MHVLLIDKSHGKARRRVLALLDSYALRTGDASWSTPITSEALGEVRQALRRIASRHVCVGCYLSVGRARMRLAWVVGRSSEFEPHGATPVAQTKRKRKPFVPLWLRRMALLASAAGHAHDIGKASWMFQRKLRGALRQADCVRHEWLSLQVWRRMRTGQSWRDAWQLGGLTGTAMRELPPFMRHGVRSREDALDFLIASHHKLFGNPSSQPALVTAFEGPDDQGHRMKPQPRTMVR